MANIHTEAMIKSLQYSVLQRKEELVQEQLRTERLKQTLLRELIHNARIKV